MQGLQVRGVREVSVSPQPKYSKSAEVVHGLQVKGIREVGVSPQPKYSKSAEVVQGLQVKAERERGRQPHREVLAKSRGCARLTAFSHFFHIFPLPAIN